MIAMGLLSGLQNLEPLSAFIISFNSPVQTQKGGGNRPIVWDILNVPHDGGCGPDVYCILVSSPRMNDPAMSERTISEECVK